MAQTGSGAPAKVGDAITPCETCGTLRPCSLTVTGAKRQLYRDHYFAHRAGVGSTGHRKKRDHTPRLPQLDEVGPPRNFSSGTIHILFQHQKQRTMSLCQTQSIRFSRPGQNNMSPTSPFLWAALRRTTHSSFFVPLGRRSKICAGKGCVASITASIFCLAQEGNRPGQSPRRRKKPRRRVRSADGLRKVASGQRQRRSKRG